MLGYTLTLEELIPPAASWPAGSGGRPYPRADYHSDKAEEPLPATDSPPGVIQATSIPPRVCLPDGGAPWVREPSRSCRPGCRPQPTLDVPNRTESSQGLFQEMKCRHRGLPGVTCQPPTPSVDPPAIGHRTVVNPWLACNACGLGASGIDP